MSSINPSEIYRLLHAAYGPQGWWPLHSRRGETGFDSRGYRLKAAAPALSRDEAFEVIVGAVLTQNTNWRNVEKALNNLFTAGIFSPEALNKLSEQDLAQLIRPSGYYRQKSKRLLRISKELFCNGELKEMSREELLSLKGIGPETADSILLYVYGKRFFIADLYTRRLSARLAGAAEMGNYEDVRALYEAQLETDLALYREFHALIVQHGKEHCSARPKCTDCPLMKECRYPDANLSP